MNKYIPVAKPVFVGNEKKYVMDCMESIEISSIGKYVEKFEQSFSKFCQAKHAISCCNGTVALHLALLALGVTKGDEVIVPTLTFVATANAVLYCGAKPVLIDSELKTWNLDINQIEALITKRTKGIIVVHLYGHPVDLDPIKVIADKYGLFILEDAAEAHGAEYKGQRVGALADIGIFSFYGNKIITSGEGGMVVTNNHSLDNKIRQLKGQGMDPKLRYWFSQIGYNYRMTNIAAAIGLAQLESITWHIEQRDRVYSWYEESIRNKIDVILQEKKDYARSSHWMFSMILGKELRISRDTLMEELKKFQIETRPIFYPMHILPMYKNFNKNRSFLISEQIASRGITLPTWAGLTKKNVSYICDCVKDCLVEKSLESV